MNRKRGSRFLTWPATALLALSLLLIPISLAAQDQDPEQGTGAEALTDATAADVGQQGAEVLGRLEMILTEGRRYQDKLAAASAEDSLVLRLQLARTQDRFMVALGDLADIVIAAKGDDAHMELRQRAESVFEEVISRIWELIGELRGEIDDLRAGRIDMTVAERSVLEDELALLGDRLDSFFQYGEEHIEKMEAFELDTAQEKEIFADLLTERADELSGRMNLATQRINELGGRLKETPDDADLTALLSANQKNLHNNAASLDITLDIMAAMDMPTDLLRAQLVTTTQDLASGLLDVKVTRTIISKAWNGIKAWTTENGPTVLVKILLFLVIMFVGRFLARQVGRVVEKSLTRANLNMSHLLKRMTVTFARNTILVLALVFGLAQLGLSLGPMLAGFGVVGFILGFAMQDSLSNLAAGMMILINRPYDVGDLVEISGVFGKVEHMSMVSTSVLTLDNQKLVVPNSKIWGDVIKNVTDQKVRRVDMTFGISYTDDIPHAEQVLKDILAGHEQVLDNPESMVRLHNLGESSVDFVVRPWVKTDDYWDVYWDVTRAVKMRFDEEDISIPFPQRDVHFYGEGKIEEGEPPREDSR